MQRIIGIDFGTSTTYMNVKRYNGDQPAEDRFSYMPVVFNYGESSGFVASIVRENADGTFDFGEKAAEQLEGARIYTEIKMLLESPDQEKRSEARRIAREFFKFLYETYSQQSANLGSADDTEDTIISYPVKWQEETAQFMLEAARDAGFQNVRGMDEATAAVSTVLCRNAGSSLICAETSGYLMLADMGAGTTDLVVCRYQAGSHGDISVEMVTSWPQNADEPTFGGREIDAVLEKYVEDYLAKALIPALAPQAHVIAAVPGQAKMWKERNVSVNLSADKPVNTCAYIGTYRNMGMLNGEFPAFGRAEFEQIADRGLRDYVRLLEGCLANTAKKDPGFAEAGLDLVILTGGHSAWYFARQIIDGTMEGYLDHPALEKVRSQKNRVVNLSNPQTTVSLGLVYSRLPFDLTRIKAPVEPSEESSGDNREPRAAERNAREQLLGIVKNAVENDPELYATNQLSDRNLLARMCANFKIPAGKTVLYINDNNTGGEEGHIFRESGIFERRKFQGSYQVRFMRWENFAKSSTKSAASSTETYEYGGTSITFSASNGYMAMKKLYNQLREDPQARQQPAYKWNAGMRETVVRYIETNSEMRTKNQIAKYPDHMSLWRKLERKYPYEIFYVGEFGKGDQSRAIIHEAGLCVCYYQNWFLGYSHGPRANVTWEEFLNSDLDDPDFMRKFIREDFGLASALSSLQAMLRKQASGAE